jgi:hypothetical protein
VRTRRGGTLPLQKSLISVTEVRFQVLKATNMKIVFWNTVELMMDTVNTSETSTKRNIPKDSHNQLSQVLIPQLHKHISHYVMREIVR